MTKIYKQLPLYLAAASLLLLLFGSCKKDAATATLKPTASFTYSPTTNLVAPQQVTFTNTSTNATTYAWNFGDGTTSSVLNPVHEFKTTGTYLVTLVASNGSDSDQKQVSIVVDKAPTVPTTVELPSVDKAVSDFMTKYSLPGVSIALVKDDRLVYAKSYGFADKATSTKLRTDHLFRLASISKSITSVALFKLIEEGKITLDATVFGKAGVLGTDYGTQPYGKNIEAITIRHLLQHTAGGWSNQQDDPMFATAWLNYTQSQLISTVLTARPLATTPGSTYDYSNFGYLILGRVIEKVSGKSYRDYVRDAILKPAGITNMDIAGDTEAEKLPNEVTYYDAGYSPYIMKVKRMDAHGGWVSSASDLARLLVQVNGFSGKADLLKSTSISQMTTPSNTGSGYACGWSVNTAGNWWHTGSLPGTSTMWARIGTGIGWVILVNQRSSAASFSTDLDALMWTGTQGITQWPTQDLF